MGMYPSLQKSKSSQFNFSPKILAEVNSVVSLFNQLCSDAYVGERIRQQQKVNKKVKWNLASAYE